MAPTETKPTTRVGLLVAALIVVLLLIAGYFILTTITASSSSDAEPEWSQGTSGNVINNVYHPNRISYNPETGKITKLVAINSDTGEVEKIIFEENYSEESDIETNYGDYWDTGSFRTYTDTPATLTLGDTIHEASAEITAEMNGADINEQITAFNELLASSDATPGLIENGGRISSILLDAARSAIQLGIQDGSIPMVVYASTGETTTHIDEAVATDWKNGVPASEMRYDDPAYDGAEFFYDFSCITAVVKASNAEAIVSALSTLPITSVVSFYVSSDTRQITVDSAEPCDVISDIEPPLQPKNWDEAPSVNGWIPDPDLGSQWVQYEDGTVEYFG